MAHHYELFRKIREALVDLYDDPVSAIRLAEDVGLDAGRIHRSGRPLDLWHSILREAERQNKVDDLLALASLAYPARTELAAMREQYAALSAEQRAELESGMELEPLAEWLARLRRIVMALFGIKPR